VPSERRSPDGRRASPAKPRREKLAHDQLFGLCAGGFSGRPVTASGFSRSAIALRQLENDREVRSNKLKLFAMWEAMLADDFEDCFIQAMTRAAQATRRNSKAYSALNTLRSAVNPC
jgi:hypothetical protein